MFSGHHLFLLLARVDLSGCWTDTPPITYEHGGAVLTAAINLNGKVGVKSLKCINFITTRFAFYLSRHFISYLRQS